MVRNTPFIISLKEHQFLKEACDIEEIKKLNIPFQVTANDQAPKYLGIDPYELCASYYIGASWLDDNHCITVSPKIPNLDYDTMMLTALRFTPSRSYFDSYYGIDTSARPIYAPYLKETITPLIIVHYLTLLKKVTTKGLKHDYLYKEDNLRSKIKGRVKPLENFRMNTTKNRNDRFYCKFQEYTVDTIENRILKKALTFSKSYLKRTIPKHQVYKEILSTIHSIEPSFSDVKEDIQLSQLRLMHQNKLFKEYSEALKLAKLILKQFDYQLTGTTATTDGFVFPFWIDMSRLYEVYVYSKLRKAYGDCIKFQVGGSRKTFVDFIQVDPDKNVRLIMDTKYKPRYEEGNKYMLDDIRQLSGYARDMRILEELGVDTNNPPLINCLIIYPSTSGLPQDDILRNDMSLLDQSVKIPDYYGFYKRSINLPIIKSNQ